MNRCWLHSPAITTATIICHSVDVHYGQDYSYFGGQKAAQAILNGNVVYLVGNDVLKIYNAQGGVCGILGSPISEFDSVTRSQRFENGVISL